MLEQSVETIRIKGDLQNSNSSYEKLCILAKQLENTKVERVEIDFDGVKFIAANLFAVLGCIFQEFYEKHHESGGLAVGNIHPKIKQIMQRNGFNIHLGWESLSDEYNTVIPYRIFDVNRIDEYDEYLTTSLFSRQDLPDMSQGAKDEIKGSLLELFKNVKDHTSSSKIFTCGQYFRNSNMLYFTIVDEGETIPYNVKTYHKEQNIPFEENSLQWAMTEGNTTSNEKTPRGIGLSLIRDFVELNEGVFNIVSGNENFEMGDKGSRYNVFEVSFPGTIVTIGLNLDDDATYCSTTEDIQF